MLIDDLKRDLHARVVCRISSGAALRNPRLCGPSCSLRAFGAWMKEADQSLCSVEATTKL